MQLNRSQKEIKNLKDYITRKKYIFAKDKATTRHPETGEPVVKLSINAKSYYLPIDQPTEVPQELWSLLVDIGLLKNTEGFDPIRG